MTSPLDDNATTGRQRASMVPRAARRNRPQFRKEQRPELRYRLSVLSAEAFSWAFWLIPGPVRGWIADRFGDLFYRFGHTYPDNVRSNVKTVLQFIGSDDDPEPIVRSIFRSSARNFMDLITLPRHSDKALDRSVTLVEGGWANLDQALAGGIGAILVTGHVGCFDLIGQVISARKYKLTIVTGRTTSRFIFDGVTYLRGKRGARLVEPTPSGVRNVMRALKRNEIAVFVTDRDFFQNGLDCVFMGQDTTLPPGAIRIARETGAPLVPVFTRRVKRGHELMIGRAFHVEKTDDMRRDLDEGLKRVVGELERGISGTLQQWVMFQRVWTDVERVPVRVFPVGSPLESELLERVASALPERDTRHGKGR